MQPRGESVFPEHLIWQAVVQGIWGCSCNGCIAAWLLLVIGVISDVNVHVRCPYFEFLLERFKV